MKKISYYLIFFVILGALVVGYWAYLKYIKEDVKEYLSFTVERGNLMELIKERGVLISNQDYDLEFPFSGTVEEIYVSEGQTVKNGDPLIKLETTDFELEKERLLAQRSQASAAVEAARASLWQYEASLEEQQARLADLEQGNLEETIKVAESKVSTATKNLEDAKIDHSNTQDKASSDLEKLLQQGLDTLELAYITANKVINQYLYEIIYSKNINSSNHCTLKMNTTSSNREWQIREDCLIALTALNAIKKDTGLHAAGSETDSILNELSAAKKNLSSIRVLLTDSLNIIDDANTFKEDGSKVTESQIAGFKTSITAAQSELESVINSITSEISAINIQLSVNRSSTDSAQKMINQAQKFLESSQAELDLSKAAASPEKITAQKSIIKQAEANIAAQQARVRQAQADVSAVNSQIKTVEEKIKKSTLSAFDDLKVSKINLEKQEVFRMGIAAISLSSSKFKIQADISELDIGKIRELEQNKVLINPDAFPSQEIVGHVTFVEEQEIEKEGDKYYRANISLDEQMEGLRSGMSADLKIIISEKKDILKIPEIALGSKNGNTVVTVLSGEKQEEKTITTGISDNEYIEVVSGLEEGQTIIVTVD